MKMIYGLVKMSRRITKVKLDSDDCAIVSFDDVVVQPVVRKKPRTDNDGCAIVSFDELSTTKVTPKTKSRPNNTNIQRELDPDTVEVDFTPVKPLPNPSEHQSAIISDIKTRNIVVDSVAGSGKTTTSLSLAKTHSDKSVLLLTYNSELRKETRSKAQLHNISNLTAHTFHSLGYAYISTSCSTDIGLIKYMKKPHKLLVPKYDIIIIDECQDMKELFYRLTIQVIKDSECTRLCVIGDVNQAIYRYAGADPRFITLAPHIYKNFSSDTWARHNLPMSYRVTTQMADFLNNCILREDRIKACKQGPKPKYNIGSDYSYALTEVNELLRSGYLPSDIYILAPSVRSTNKNNPIKRLANMFTATNIPIYIPVDDTSRVDPDVAKNKIVFGSFHQSKGLERRAVLALGIDASYHTFYASDEPTDRCSNAVYVALTRAQEYLSMYHISNNAPFSFVDMELVSVFADVRGELRNTKPTERYKVPDKVGITQLLRHMTTESITACIRMFDRRVIRDADTHIDIPNKVKQCIDGRYYVEEVCEITGTAIPAYYEFMTAGTMTIAKTICEVGNEITPDQLLTIANKYSASVSGLDFKTKQITQYGWLNQENLNACFDRMYCEIARKYDNDDIPIPSFEVKVSADVAVPGHAIMNISGNIDVLMQDRIIEIKCTSELKPEHMIQLAIYSYCYGEHALRLHLYNIASDELIELTCERAKILEMIQFIIKTKYYPEEVACDEQFLEKIRGFAPV